MFIFESFTYDNNWAAKYYEDFYNASTYFDNYLNKDYKANIKTLCHELTHSYQHTHNTERYLKSCEALREGRVLYRNAWHEVDARQQAEIMCEYYYGLKNVI